MVRTAKRWLCAALLPGMLFAAPACTGQVAGTGAADGDGGEGGDEGGSSGDGGRGGSSSGGSGVGGKIEGVDLTCGSREIDPGVAPLRRMTNEQYRNTLKELFGSDAPAVELPDEVFVKGYNTIAQGQAPSLALLEGFSSAAATVAEKLSAQASLAKIAPCAAGSNEDACGRTFLTTWGKRIYRRPLDADETNRLVALFGKTKAASSYAEAVRTSLQAMLMSPQFLYLMEEGKPVDGKPALLKLSGHEVATRLAYLLWDSAPDAALVAAADAGKLDDTKGIEAEITRLLGDARARASVARFEAQWLNLGKLEGLKKDAKAFPNFTDAVATTMRTSVEKFLERMFWDGAAKIETLLLDTHAFVDAQLAPLYKVNASGSGLQWVDVGDKRAGLLTQAGIMAALAKGTYDSPVHRGLFVLDHLLCADMPNPPGDVPPLADPKPGEDAKTTRQRVEQSHAAPTCAACHKSIDPIGFGFGKYDAVGTYREEESGVKIDATGEITGTRDANGKFDGAVAIAKLLAKSNQVKQCVATQWFRYGFGRVETDGDSCALRPIVDKFVSSGGDMKALLVAMVTSDAFRYRKSPTP